MDTVAPIIDNIATYMECLPLEAASATWSAVIPLSEAFLRKVLPLMQNLTGMDGILRTMACLMRLPGISAFKVPLQFHMFYDSRFIYLTLKF